MAVKRSFITKLITDTRCFYFRKPIEVVEGRQGLYYWHETDPLALMGYGRTRRQSLKMLEDLFDLNWDGLVLEDDSKLTGGAIRLKLEMLDLVERIVTEDEALAEIAEAARSGPRFDAKTVMRELGFGPDGKRLEVTQSKEPRRKLAEKFEKARRATKRSVSINEVNRRLGRS